MHKHERVAGRTYGEERLRVAVPRVEAPCMHLRTCVTSRGVRSGVRGGAWFVHLSDLVEAPPPASAPPRGGPAPGPRTAPRAASTDLHADACAARAPLKHSTNTCTPSGVGAAQGLVHAGLGHVVANPTGVLPRPFRRVLGPP